MTWVVNWALSAGKTILGTLLLLSLLSLLLSLLMLLLEFEPKSNLSHCKLDAWWCSTKPC